MFVPIISHRYIFQSIVIIIIVFRIPLTCILYITMFIPIPSFLPLTMSIDDTFLLFLFIHSYILTYLFLNTLYTFSNWLVNSTYISLFIYSPSIHSLIYVLFYFSFFILCVYLSIQLVIYLFIRNFNSFFQAAKSMLVRNA